MKSILMVLDVLEAELMKSIMMVPDRLQVELRKLIPKLLDSFVLWHELIDSAAMWLKLKVSLEVLIEEMMLRVVLTCLLIWMHLPKYVSTELNL